MHLSTAVAAALAVLTVAGFTGAGIAAGSDASSAAAVANGGGAAARSVLEVLKGDAAQMDYCTIIAAGAGAVIAVVAAPAVLTAAGFTGAGIAAGSVASSLMSTAAVANGGTIAAGSMVAGLQAAGAAGIPVATQAVIGAIGGTVGAVLGGPLICSAGATGAVTSGGVMGTVGTAVSSVARLISNCTA